MSSAAIALPASLSLLRFVSQGLVSATAAADPVSAVSSLLALQGQQVSAIPHALVVRAPSSTATDVRRAFDEGGLVRSWPMRGTIHVTASEDHHWLRSALRHRYAAYERECKRRFGISDALVERAADSALAEIAASGPLTRQLLVEAWTDAGIFAEAQRAYRELGESEDDAARLLYVWKRRLVLLLHIRGLLVQGPMGPHEHLVVDASTLPDETRGPAPGQRVSKGEAGHGVALVEIARRYAAGHGPVSAADLSRWTTLPMGECARALEVAIEVEGADVPIARFRLNAGGEDLEPYTAPLNARERTSSAFYMRADALDLLKESSEQARATMFLGMFDEVHVGYKDRTCLADSEAEALICPGKNGVFLPFVVDRGRVVAVRRAGDLMWVEARMPAQLAAAAIREVTRVNALLGA